MKLLASNITFLANESKARELVHRLTSSEEDGWSYEARCNEGGRWYVVAIDEDGELVASL